MRLTMFTAALKAKRTSIVAYSLGGFASLWLYAAIYPSLAQQSQSLNTILQSFPPAILKALGSYTPGLTNFTFETLLATKQFGLVWPLLVLFMMVAFAGSTLAGEVEQTTLGLWLSAPVSRLSIYWSKFAAGILGLAIFVVTSVLTIMPLARVYNLGVNSHHIVVLSVVGGLFGLAVFSLAMLVSSLAASKGRVYGTISGLLLVMFVLNLVAELNDKLADLKYISFFYYYNSTDLLTSGTVNHWSYVVFGGTTVVAALAGMVIFSRRNLSI